MQPSGLPWRFVCGRRFEHKSDIIVKINFGFFLAKAFRFLNRPALRDCEVSRCARVGTGSNLIHVKMGDYSYCGKNCSMLDTEIGSFCSIASYCAIGGAAHPMTNVSTSPVFSLGRNVFNKNLGELATPEAKPVIIGSDVWIGEKVFVKDGIHIGHGAVIGAHSVVTEDVPSYAIVAGTPAKIIRYRFEEKQIERLLESRWWELPAPELKALSQYMTNVDLFLEKVGKKA